MSKTKFPENIRHALYASFGSEQNLEIGRAYDLTIGQLAGMTGLISHAYRKEFPLAQLKDNLKRELSIDDVILNKLFIDLLVKRFLVVDKEWFEGQVSQLLKSLGDNPESHGEYVEEYLKKIESEKVLEIAEANMAMDTATKAAGNKLINDRYEDAPEFIKNPEAEMKSFRKVFANNLKDVFLYGDYELKTELNVRLITLLLNDESGRFQRDLLDEMYRNEEMVGEASILYHEEKVNPTIGHFIKDYVGFVGIEDVISNINKASYFTTSPNVKNLTQEQRELLSRVFELYVSLKGFYTNIGKQELEDIRIFPYSVAEEENFEKKAREELKKAEKVTKQAKQKEEIKVEAEKVSVMDFYREKPEDEVALKNEKELLEKETRREIYKLADKLDDALLRRKRYTILAALEILAETGGLDNILAKDKRFVDLLSAYFRRNNLADEEAGFKSNPYQAKYLQHFLKFIFLERLGMNSEAGAKFAVKISNIFREKGVDQYAEMAYFDLSDNKFKWI